MIGIHKSFPKVLASLIVMAVASPALAQAPRSGFDVIVSNGVPEFRDPRTGKVWTPDIVGQDGKPVAPDDRAFDPFAQVVPVEGVIEQQVRGRPRLAFSPASGRSPLGAVIDKAVSGQFHVAL
jgi:hypothetical protein